MSYICIFFSIGFLFSAIRLGFGTVSKFEAPIEFLLLIMFFIGIIVDYEVTRQEREDSWPDLTEHELITESYLPLIRLERV